MAIFAWGRLPLSCAQWRWGLRGWGVDARHNDGLRCWVGRAHTHFVKKTTTITTNEDVRERNSHTSIVHKWQASFKNTSSGQTIKIMRMSCCDVCWALF